MSLAEYAATVVMGVLALGLLVVSAFESDS